MTDFQSNEMIFHIIVNNGIVFSRKFAIFDKKLSYLKECELDFFDCNNLFEGFVISSLNHKLRVPTHIKFGEGDSFDYILLFINSDDFKDKGYLPILLSMGMKGKGFNEIWGGERKILNSLSEECKNKWHEKYIDKNINKILKTHIDKRYETLEKKSRERFVSIVAANKKDYTSIWDI